MNLSRVKTLGFIPEFNSRKSYPEFGLQLSKKVVSIPIVKEIKLKTVSSNKLAIKKAKLTSKWQHGNTPRVLVSNKLK